MASKSNQPAGNWEQRTRQPDGSSAASGRGDEGILSEMATTVKDKAQGMASAVASTAEDAWDGTRQGVQRAASAVADTAGDAWGDLTGLMRRYPFGTLFVGIGVGFLVSRLLEERGTQDFRRLGADLYDRVRDYIPDVASKLRS
jgi:ElaB/YqjD/DUF883 family membrane-anchored ribosome-binding protein